MSIYSIVPLIALAFALGYLAGLSSAKRIIKDAAEEAVNDFTRAKENEEKARLQ